MKSLTINDLPVNEELDRKAMAMVRGGAPTSLVNFVPAGGLHPAASGQGIEKPNPGKMNWEHYFDTSSTAIMG